MILRTLPWFTDDSILFLNNLFKWYPKEINKELTLLEFGGGNSTLYFLQKNCKILTVESNDEFIKDLYSLAISTGATAKIVESLSQVEESFLNFDLIILKAKSYDEIGSSIFGIVNWDIIVNDGISRKEVLQMFYKESKNSILILDNCEYCANWGRLARSSAKVDTVRVYREFLRNNDWNKYLFEQKEGRDGYCTTDATGWESPNKWVTGVLWNKNHILNKFMITNIGFPLINLEGISDKDINSLEKRCPYDFKNMKWTLDEYPISLDLKLERSYI